MEKSSEYKNKLPLWKKPILWAVITIILIMPMATTIVTSVIPNPLENFSTSNDWIGFFGSYTGSIIGGGITLLVMYISIKNGDENVNKSMQQNKDLQNENNRIQFCNDIATIVAEFCGSTRTLSEDLRNSNILFEKYKFWLNEYSKRKNIIEEYKSQPKGLIDLEYLTDLEKDFESATKLLSESKEQYFSAINKISKEKAITTLFLIEIKLRNIESGKILIEKIKKLNSEMEVYIDERKNKDKLIKDIINLDYRIEEILNESTKFIDKYSKYNN